MLVDDARQMVVEPLLEDRPEHLAEHLLERVDRRRRGHAGGDGRQMLERMTAGFGDPFVDQRRARVMGAVRGIDPPDIGDGVLHPSDVASGIVGFGNATVRWFLSVNSKHLPDAIREKGQRTYRSITFDGEGD